MLILNRRPGDSIFIGDDIEIVFKRVDGNEIAVGVIAPRDLRILRNEHVYVCGICNRWSERYDWEDNNGDCPKCPKEKYESNYSATRR